MSESHQAFVKDWSGLYFWTKACCWNLNLLMLRMKSTTSDFDKLSIYDCVWRHSISTFLVSHKVSNLKIVFGSFFTVTCIGDFSLICTLDLIATGAINGSKGVIETRNRWLTHTLLQRTLYSKHTLCIVTFCSKNSLLQIGLTQFALLHTLPLNTCCSSKHLTPQHTLLQRTFYSSEHFAPQHTLLQRTFYSLEHFYNSKIEKQTLSLSQFSLLTSFF